MKKKKKKNSTGCSQTNLYTGIVTHGALEWFLMSVLVASVSHQLSTGDKGHVTVSALMWSGACQKGKKRLFQFLIHTR